MDGIYRLNEQLKEGLYCGGEGSGVGRERGERRGKGGKMGVLEGYSLINLRL